jgi:hypothetical protein
VGTSSHKTTVDPAGNPVRVVTNAGVDSGAEQQVTTLADSTGAFHGVAGNPIIVTHSGTVVVGGAVDVTGSVVSVTGSVVAISGTVPVSGPLTDTQLRATAVPVSGTVGVSGTVPVSGPLTDTQLRAAALPVSGTFWQATQPVSGPLTDTQLRATAVPISAPRPATGTLTNVAGSVTSGTILAANTARVGATIWNDSTAILYLRLASGTASATACSVKLIADAYYEVPFGYAGVITGVWASATGSARVSELT